MGVVAQGVSLPAAVLYDRGREAVRCHFHHGKAPKLIRLHYVRDEVIAA
jgi:hypothetical protein